MSGQGTSSSVDIARLLNDGPWTRFQKWVLVFAALAFAVDGLANQVLGLAIPALIGAWHATKGDFAPVAAAGLVGVAIGTAIGGVAGDRFGRRAALIGSVLLFGVMTAVTATADGPTSLLWMRFVAGIGIGGAIPNGTALIAEFTPANRRSLAIALGMVFIPVGALISGLLGAAILPAIGWRGLFLTAGALPVLLALAFVFVLPESPRFLIDRPSHRSQLTRILERMGRRFDPAISFVDPPHEHARTPLRAVFGADIRFDTLALWIAFFFCLLASYSMFSWIPTMLAGKGFDLRATSFGMTAFNLGGIIGGVSGGWLIGRYGSRVPVTTLSALGVIGAVVLGVLPFDASHGFGIAVAVLVIEGIFIAALHNGLYTVAAHVYPPFVRASGVGAASGVGRIGAVVSSFTGVLTLQLGGASSYFIVIAVCVAISLVSLALIRRQIPGHAGEEPRSAAAALQPARD